MARKGEPGENSIPEDQRHAALELAATVGPAAAARHLGISRQSIYRWAELYPQLWSDLRAGDPKAHRRGVAARLEDLTDRYAAAEHDLLLRVEEVLIEQAGPKEAAALIKALGSSRMAATAGMRVLTGEADQVVEHNINFPALEAAMERLLEGAPTTLALPIPEAEVVEGD